MIQEKTIIPNTNESAVISDKVKTAALCYDRVWSPQVSVFQWYDVVPESIRFFGGTPAEMMLNVNFAAFGPDLKHWPNFKKFINTNEGRLLFRQSIPGILKDVYFEKSAETSVKRHIEASMMSSNERQECIDNSKIVSDFVFRDIALSFAGRYGIPVVTMTSSIRNQKLVYSAGQKQCLLMCLEDLQIVDEEHLSWDQVLAFRKDAVSLSKYRRFMHWLDKDMIDKPYSVVRDEIMFKLEDYEDALRKHGIKTILGEISEILVGGGLFVLIDPKLGLLASGSLAIGKLLVKLVKIAIDYDDVEKGVNSEISWVYQVKKLQSGDRVGP